LLCIRDIVIGALRKNMRKFSSTSALLALALVGCSCAHGLPGGQTNESCSHFDGACGKNLLVTHSPGSDSDYELLGQMDKNFNYDAMRPASFPSYLPGMAAGNLLSSASLNLPQPQLTQGHRNRNVKEAKSPFVMDALGLF
jgi:hypothetical protein